MDAEERELFAKSLQQATAGTSGPALDAALDDLGWSDALAADPRAAVSLLFGAQGTSASTSSALDRVLLDALGPDLPPDAGVVFPPAGRWDPPGTLAGQSVAVEGLATHRLGERDRAVVVAPSGDGFVAALVDPGDLALRPVEGIDPRLGIVAVAGQAVPAAATAPAAWVEALAAGQRALAHELVGASRAMLGLARDHAVERIQFGRPIAAFQAVRHRLAEALVAVEAADAALAAGWDDPAPLTAALAKALAGRGAKTVARHAQQVLAGIGFTTEHDLHIYVRRVLVLDQLLGDAGSLTRRLGEDLLAERHLPSILPL